MKIMTFTPYGHRLEPETVQAVLALEHDGEITRVFQHMPPTGDARVDILAQYRRGRELFLSSDCDALLVVESDIIPPPDALRKLIALDADCAYGVYRYRNSNNINVAEKYTPNARNEGEPLTVHPHKLQRAIRAGRVNSTQGGLGIVLMRRHVLKNIDFRLAPNAHCDTWFNRDVFEAQLKQMADMSVVCGHKNEHGEILWPEYHAR